MPDDQDPPTTQELRAIQSRKQRDERDAADDAPTESGVRAHQRRAAKAAYLEERLAEQQRAEEKS